MFFTAALQVVFNTTGGRIWNKRWGLPRLSRTRKENRRRDIRVFNQNLDVLKAAAHLQPEVPVRLAKPLPAWQVAVMRARLEQAQQDLNLRAAGVAVPAQRWQQPQRRPRQLAGPPVDPQQQQRLNQREVTRIRQEQLKRFQQATQQQQQQQQQQPAQQQQQQQQQVASASPGTPT